MPEEAGHSFKADSSLVTEVVASPNFNDRRADTVLDMIILHYTGMESVAGALNWLCHHEAEVSSHYLIDEEGKVTQLVAEKYRAWHAGQSCWKSVRDINSHSIGIEITNPGHEYGYVDFPQIQMDAVVALVGDITRRNLIPPQYILAHSDIAPLRKQDPGERFDWRQLYEAGLGMWVEPAPIIEGDQLGLGDQGVPVKTYQMMLGELGFEVEKTGNYDELTYACTTAFQRHFRQEKVDGIADHSTVETLKRLLAKSNRSNGNERV